MNNGQGQSMAERMAAEAAARQGQQQMPPSQQQVPVVPMVVPQQPGMQEPQMGAPVSQPQFPAPPPGAQGVAPMGMLPPGGQQPMQPPQQYQQPQYQQPQQQVPPQQQPQQQAYAPTVGPNPPEMGAQVPQQQEMGSEDGESKRGRGRPAGSRNTKKNLDVDQQVFLAGVTAGISNPQWNGDVGLLVQAGDAALQAFKQKFPK